MIYRYTILYVDDVPQQMNLYQQGLGLETLFLHPGKDYGELATGDTKLCFSSRQLMESVGKTPGRPDPARPLFELTFEVPRDQVAAAYAKAQAAGFVPKQEVQEEAWGQLTSYVVDPHEGTWVSICSPIYPRETDENGVLINSQP